MKNKKISFTLGAMLLFTQSFSTPTSRPPSRAARDALEKLFGTEELIPEIESACAAPLKPKTLEAARFSFMNGVGYHSMLDQLDLKVRIQSADLLQETPLKHFNLRLFRHSTDKSKFFTVVEASNQHPLLIEKALFFPQEISRADRSSFLMALSPEHELLLIQASKADDPELRPFFEIRMTLGGRPRSLESDQFMNCLSEISNKEIAKCWKDAPGAPLVSIVPGYIFHASPNQVYVFEVAKTAPQFFSSSSLQILPGWSALDFPRLEISDDKVLRVIRPSGETTFRIGPAGQLVELSTSEAPIPMALPPIEELDPNSSSRRTAPRVAPRPSNRISLGEWRLEEFRRGGARDLHVSLLGEKEIYNNVRQWYFVGKDALLIIEPNNIISFLMLRKTDNRDLIHNWMGSLDEYSGAFSRIEKAHFRETAGQPILRKVGSNLFVFIPWKKGVSLFKARLGTGRFLHFIDTFYFERAENNLSLFNVPAENSVGVKVGQQRFLIEIQDGENWSASGALRGPFPSTWKAPEDWKASRGM